ncbi:MAG: metallophosphoesterase family protein [Bacteroidota bacterium]
MQIGLLSDTHGTINDEMLQYFKDCDEIWHAGDLGSLEVVEQIQRFKTLKAVYGNIDDATIRSVCPEEQFFICAGLKIYIIHIGGYPPKYTNKLKKRLDTLQPDVFVCGHSHILKIIPDRERNLLHLNPGAAGNHGFHKVRTMLRFAIKESRVCDMELIELGKRGKT